MGKREPRIKEGGESNLGLVAQMDKNEWKIEISRLVMRQNRVEGRTLWREKKPAFSMPTVGKHATRLGDGEDLKWMGAERRTCDLFSSFTWRKAFQRRKREDWEKDEKKKKKKIRLTRQEEFLSGVSSQRIHRREGWEQQPFRTSEDRSHIHTCGPTLQWTGTEVIRHSSNHDVGSTKTNG
jgi:hypothetical protein